MNLNTDKYLVIITTKMNKDIMCYYKTMAWAVDFAQRAYHMFDAQFVEIKELGENNE